MVFLHISSLEPIPDALSQNKVLTQPLPISSKFEGLNRGLFGYSGITIPTHPDILDILYIQWIY
jgi:hypothetical protein